MKFRSSLLGAAAALSLSLVASTAMSADKPTIGVVVKIGGIPWFNAMEQGIEEAGERLGVDAFMVGPTSADPALQVRAIEDLIARGVDVIGVVPNDAKVLEPVLKRARDAGIKVITHESEVTENKDYNFELISTESFGEAYAKLFADSTQCKGSYAIYVGGLTVPAHNAWADSSMEHLKKYCPDMKQVSERFGVAESVDDSRTTTLDLMRAHEDLSGIMAFGSQGPIGAARAVQERELTGKFTVVGLFSPGQGKRLVHSGALTGGYSWSPLEAGKVFVELGKMLTDGETLSDGQDVPTLGPIKLEGKNVYGAKLLNLDKESVDGLAKMGL